MHSPSNNAKPFLHRLHPRARYLPEVVIPQVWQLDCGHLHTAPSVDIRPIHCDVLMTVDDGSDVVCTLVSDVLAVVNDGLIVVCILVSVILPTVVASVFPIVE